MRIYLISPTHYRPDGSLVKSRRYGTSALTLPYLKAPTPPSHEVRFVDELMGDVDLTAACDLVDITAMGPQIRRAYDLADWYRSGRLMPGAPFPERERRSSRPGREKAQGDRKVGLKGCT